MFVVSSVEASLKKKFLQHLEQASRNQETQVSGTVLVIGLDITWIKLRLKEELLRETQKWVMQKIFTERQIDIVL